MEQDEFNKLKNAIVEAKQEMRQSQARIDKLVDELMSDQDTSILLDAILHAQHRKRVHHWPPPWRPWVYEETEQPKMRGGALDHHLIDDWGGLNRSDGGFSDEEIKIIVEIANSLKSTLQDDIQFLDGIIEQVQDPTRAGLTPEQLARMDYIAKHNARSRWPHGWPFPHDLERIVLYPEPHDPRPKDDYFIPRTIEYIDAVINELGKRGIEWESLSPREKAEILGNFPPI